MEVSTPKPRRGCCFWRRQCSPCWPAGVVIALAIPYRGLESTAYKLEKALHNWVVFLILPVFAFANAGVDLAGLGFADLGQKVTLGVILGLVVGKLIGVLGYFLIV